MSRFVFVPPCLGLLVLALYALPPVGNGPTPGALSQGLTMNFNDAPFAACSADPISDC